MKKLFSLMLLLPFCANANMLLLPSYDGNKAIKIYIDENNSDKQHLLITEELYGNRMTYNSSFDCDNKKLNIPAISYFKPKDLEDEQSYKTHIINNACQWVKTDKECNNYLQIEAAYSMLIKSCYNDQNLKEFKPSLIKQDFVTLNERKHCSLEDKLTQNKMKYFATKLNEHIPDMKNYCKQNQDSFVQIELAIKKAIKEIESQK